MFDSANELRALVARINAGGAVFDDRNHGRKSRAKSGNGDPGQARYLLECRDGVAPDPTARFETVHSLIRSE